MADKTLTLKAKKSYYARVRSSNYRASMRLEGFQVSKAPRGTIHFSTGRNR